VVIAVYPIKIWLVRKGWPGWAAILSLIVVIYGTLVGGNHGARMSCVPAGVPRRRRRGVQRGYGR
jgi:hypothetical protein